MMVNQNPHYLDMWNWFFGLPDKVYAAMEFGRYNNFTVDDAIDLQVFYDSGFHGTFISATGEAPGINRLEIWGSKGRLTLEGNKITLALNAVDTEEFGKTNTEKFARIPYEIREEIQDGQINPYTEVFENFAAHLLSGVPLAADGYDGLRQVQLANAVYVSGWEEKRIQIPVCDDRYRDGLAQRQKMEKNK